MQGSEPASESMIITQQRKNCNVRT